MSTSLLIRLIVFGIIAPFFLDVFYLRSRLNVSRENIKKSKLKEVALVLLTCFFFYGSSYSMVLKMYHKNYAGGVRGESFLKHFFVLTNFISSVEESFASIKNPLLKKYQKQTRLDQYSLNKEFQDKPQTVVFIFGESLNASHLIPNGYKRDTTPLLRKQKNITFLSKTKSCATNTGTAHPCMTKPFVTKNYLDPKNIYPLIMNPKIHSFFDIFKANGFKTYYLGIFHQEPSLKLLRQGLDEYHFLNEVESPREYFKYLDKFIKDSPAKKLIIISTGGEHYPYKQEKGFEKFPIKNNIKKSFNLKNDLKDKKYLYNRYDNAILYTDKLMNKTIELFKKTKQNSLVYFFSDHGENLDNPHFGIHGSDYLNAPYDVTHPGAFLWVSDNWLKNINPKTLNLFKRFKDKEFSYDNIFHSVLNCSGFQSKYIDASKSLCSE